ncbi:hypothetical protein ACHAQD_009217 [Fusarium lateritium]
MSSSGNVKKPRPKRKGRPRPLPPDVTARNLAIEKQRREALNENFLELARMLPNLASARRLTKVLIVNASVEHVRQQRTMCLAAAQDMHDVLAENNRLVAEVNAWRAQFGEHGAPPAQLKPMTESMIQLEEVKNQVFGTFNAGFGDNWVEDTSQSQPNAGAELPGTMQQVDGSYAAFEPQTEVILPPDDIHTNTEALAPTMLSGHPYQEPQINPELYMGTTASHSSMAYSNTFEPALSEQMIAEMYTQPLLDSTSLYWSPGLGINANLGLLHDENGDAQRCIA